tara:strand:+ start:236 stop:1318 length:1083 start_codon:yes stop_codon:yes gene_type:complete
MKKRIKTAVVGLQFGEYIVDYQIVSWPGEPFIKLAGVFDLDTSKSLKVSRRHNVRQYTSLEEILADDSIEAIGLFTPPGGRAKLIRKIIRAGKHVITTKPFELNAPDALAVLNEAKRLNKIVHINSPEPLPDAETAQILQWQESFQLGPPVAARWETYTRYNDQPNGSWADDPERCPMAPIFRLGIYGINQLLRLCGEVDAVNVAHSRLFTGRLTPDNGELSLQFKNGALGNVFASFCIDDGHRYANTLCIHYERGSMRSEVSQTFENFDIRAKKISLRALDSKHKVISHSVNLDTEQLLGKYQWENFRNAVLCGQPLAGEVNPQMVAHAIQVINAMSEAERTANRVRISELRPCESTGK